MERQSRRTFIKNTAKAAGILPLTMIPLNGLATPKVEDKLNISVFSKHLQFLDYQDMAKMAAQIGFDGVDLTVRPKGHVLPERVTQDLPKAIDAIGSAGFKPYMMTSGVNDAGDDTDQTVLKTAAELGIKFYRMGYFRYTKDGNIPDDVKNFQKKGNSPGKVKQIPWLGGMLSKSRG